MSAAAQMLRALVLTVNEVNLTITKSDTGTTPSTTFQYDVLGCEQPGMEDAPCCTMIYN